MPSRSAAPWRSSRWPASATYHFPAGPRAPAAGASPGAMSRSTMTKNLIRGGARALLVILALVASTLPARAADPPLVVGFVYVSPIGEAGWTYQHELGRRALERALGPRVKTVFVEAVAEGPDSERVMRDLVAAQGATLVFATSFGYLDPALRVAAEFPA